MSDDTARAVGANGAEEIVIAGKRCTVRPLTLKELGEVERECLKRYKRSYLETFSDNADLLAEDERTKLIREKLEEIARWDVHNLPLRRAYDPQKVVVNAAIEEWVKTNFEDFIAESLDDKKKKKLIQRLVTTGLDNGTLSPELYEHMAGRLPNSANVGYVNWWITACYDGQIEMIYACFKHNNVTRDEICEELGTNPTLMINISREIEHVTSPKAGNT